MDPFFMGYLTTISVDIIAADGRTLDNWEGNGCGLIEVLSWNLVGEIEETLE
jgi:hypothetical protein